MSEVSRESVLVTGAGGFISHHLVACVKRRGYWMRGVDLKRPEYTPVHPDQFELLNLRGRDKCLLATRGVDHIYTLAADMGGMGHLRQPRHRPPRQRAHQPEHAGVSQAARAYPATYSVRRHACTPRTCRPRRT
jgi:nucleoside-diphosphate-sugar epimerase